MQAMTDERLEELRQIAGGLAGEPKSDWMDELIDEIDRLRAIVAETHSAAWLASVAAIEVFADRASKNTATVEHIDAMLEAAGHLADIAEGGRRLPPDRVVAVLESWVVEIKAKKAAKGDPK